MRRCALGAWLAQRLGEHEITNHDHLAALDGTLNSPPDGARLRFKGLSDLVMRVGPA